MITQHDYDRYIAALQSMRKFNVFKAFVDDCFATLADPQTNAMDYVEMVDTYPPVALTSNERAWRQFAHLEKRNVPHHHQASDDADNIGHVHLSR